MRRGIIRYFDIPVIGMQRQIPAGNKLAVMGDHQVVPCLFVLVVGIYGNIAFHGRGLAVNRDCAVYRFQGHVLFCCHRINVRAVVAHMDVARIGLQGYTAIVGNDRFYNINIAVAGGNRHVLFCGYASRSIAAYRNIALSGLQDYRSLR